MTNIPISESRTPLSMTHGQVSEEVWDLAEHHKEILERRFPNYHYILYEWPYYWPRIEIFGPKDGMVLVVSFTPSSIKIAIPPFKVKTLTFTSSHDPNFTEEIHYADPKFTDSTLSDVLEKVAK